MFSLSQDSSSRMIARWWLEQDAPQTLMRGKKLDRACFMSLSLKNEFNLTLHPQHPLVGFYQHGVVS